MGKMKFYAIKSPSVQKIVTSWLECEKLTHGVKGCLFKSFATREDAESWLSGVSETHGEGLRIYVDGSFTPDFDRAGWAFIAVENDKQIGAENGVTDLPAESRNIDGELTASLHALAWLKRMGKTGVICHDYEGIARWAKGEWKANKPIAIRYKEAVKEFPNAKFEKVPAHSGVKWNEAVDQLAKKAIADCKAREKAAKMAKTAKPATPAAAKPVVKTVENSAPTKTVKKEVPAQTKTPERMPSPGESLDLFG